MPFCPSCHEPVSLCICKKTEDQSASSASVVAMARDEYDGLKQQVTNQQNDSCRLRLLRNAALRFTFTSEQVRELVQLQHFSDAKKEVAALLYPVTVDKGSFAATVLPAFRFEEERQQVRAQLQL
eukprot:gnl/Spiro4/1913_TR902_c0_g1_i2.p1 gnl/Spiro4/1913_TR902_c0_g1~~gnl/Spiro4/1913_TR902_c0_g1_i2.p1  ORF type:complete len:125 (+),score=18.40 gnl/Spiro4/1913_TR902_c0_g1_i2:77-451(+)